MIRSIIIVLTLFCTVSFAKLPTLTLRTVGFVYINGTITEHTMDKAIKDLLLQIQIRSKVAKKTKKIYPIFIVLDSPGGSVFAGERFIKVAKNFSKIHTVTLSAASMAHTIVQSLPGFRYVDETGYFMAHRAKATFSGQFGEGELERQLRFIKSLVTNIEKRVSARIGIDLLTYRNKIKDEWWSTSTEAIKENVADVRVKAVCSMALIRSTVRKVKNTMFGPIEYESSGCPFINGKIEKLKTDKQIKQQYYYVLSK